MPAVADRFQMMIGGNYVNLEEYQNWQLRIGFCAGFDSMKVELPAKGSVDVRAKGVVDFENMVYTIRKEREIREPPGWKRPSKPLVSPGPSMAVAVPLDACGRIAKVQCPKHCTANTDPYMFVRIPEKPNVQLPRPNELAIDMIDICGDFMLKDPKAGIVLLVPLPSMLDPSAVRVPGDAAEVRETFRLFDVNGDGVVDCDELSKVLISLDPAKWDEEKARKLLSNIDASEDGSIQYHEFLDWIFASKASDGLDSFGVANVASIATSWIDKEAMDLPRVSIVNLAGKLQCRLTIDPSDSVSMLKSRLRMPRGYEVTLLLGDQSLFDEDSLQKYDIGDGATLTCVMQSPKNEIMMSIQPWLDAEELEYVGGEAVRIFESAVVGFIFDKARNRCGPEFWPLFWEEIVIATDLWEP